MTEPHAASAAELPAAPSETPPKRTRWRALGGLALLGAMAGAVWAFGYWEPRLLPVRTVEVQGELHHHSSELLRETLVARLDGGFLTADLKDLKEAAEGLPWVGGAGIRRVWPDRLQVRVQEHRPVARWKDDGLVTGEGVVFHPRSPIPAGLPVLAGDEGRARELVERYLKWRDELMLAGQLIDTLTVDARGAWHLDLVSNTRVELGTDDIERRLARFIAAVPQLEAAGRTRVVDLRYRNGFAVRWAGNADLASADASPAVSPPAKAVPGKAVPGKARGRGARAVSARRVAPGAAAVKGGGKAAATAPRAAARPPAAPAKAGAPSAPGRRAAPAKAGVPSAPGPRAAPAGRRASAPALTQTAPVRR